MATTYDEAVARCDEVTSRLLAIDVELTRSKAAWLNDRVSPPHGRRAALEAEAAMLRYQRHQLALQIRAGKAEARRVRRECAYWHLSRLVTERGYSDLVAEAERLANPFNSTHEESPL